MLSPNACSEMFLAKPWWDIDIIILVAETCSAWVKKRDKYNDLGKTDFDVVPTSFHIMHFMFHIHHSLFTFLAFLFYILQQNWLSLFFHEVSRYQSLPR
jgi:hypothetical protein